VVSDPICKGKCKGMQRATWDSPSAFGRLSDGSKVVFCTCCLMVLRRATAIESIADPPNIPIHLDRKSAVRYVDDVCGYDTVVIPEIREATAPQ
jgi:hypothetical protein